MRGTFRVSDRSTGETVADVRIDEKDDGAYVFVRWFGKGEWVEDPEAFGLLLGELGSVDRLSE